MTPQRILLVEDDDDQRSVLRDLLGTEGYSVTDVASAEEALEQLHADTFDLMVTDYQLGGATGSWLARVAARSAAAPSPPALLMTGHRTISDGEGLKVLRKPLAADLFLHEVRQAIAGTPPAGRDLLGPSQRIAFILYVSGSLASQRAVADVRSVLDEYVPSQIALTIVDLSSEAAHQAEEHRVMVTPTLLKTFPAPRVWIAGQPRPTDLLKRLLEQAGVEARK